MRCVRQDIMSRLGKLPIKLPEAVQAKLEKGFLTVKGPKGELKLEIKAVKVDVSTEEIKVSISESGDKRERTFWGLYRSLINNMVVGVTNGFEKKLEVIGVGYRAAIAGKKLTLNVGYSHPVDFILPDGIDGKVEGNAITISGFDKQLVGEMAAQIRKIRKPEPYKGKGIRYSDEIIIKKEGKAGGRD